MKARVGARLVITELLAVARTRSQTWTEGDESE